MSTTGDLTKRSLEVLADLGAHPAVAYWEADAASAVRRRIQGLGFAPQADAHGNIVVRCPGRDADETPIALVAHMDHPGFEAVESDGDRLIVHALGGVPQACFSQSVPVQLLAPGGERLHGKLDGAHGPPEQRMARLRLDADAVPTLPRPVVLDLPDFQCDDERVTMRAVDDLAGCAAMLLALESLAQEPGPGDVYLLFTRAEEVGLIGARLIAQERRLPPECLVISLEASRALPGAAIGEGPVLRVGDATYTFDADAEQVLHVAREELRAADPEFKAQRQLMSGGTCEASAFAVHGYATTGIAFPLGNYHNATDDGGVGPEYIALSDFLLGVKLVRRAVRSGAKRHDSPARRRLGEVPSEPERRLRETSAL